MVAIVLKIIDHGFDYVLGEGRCPIAFRVAVEEVIELSISLALVPAHHELINIFSCLVLASWGLLWLSRPDTSKLPFQFHSDNYNIANV